MQTLLLQAALLVTWVATPMMAQSGSSDGKGRGSQVDFLADYLSLTDAQKTAATGIFDTAKAAREALSTSITTARDNITAAVKRNAAEVEFDNLGKALGELQGKVAAIEAKADAKFYALLTAEQKTKYDNLRSRTGRGPGGAGMNRIPRGGREF